MNPSTIEISRQTLSSLAAQYQISVKTMRKWYVFAVQLIGRRRGNYFNPGQVRAFYEIFGVPSSLPDTYESRNLSSRETLEETIDALQEKLVEISKEESALQKKLSALQRAYKKVSNAKSNQL